MTQQTSKRSVKETAVSIGQYIGAGWGSKNIGLMAASISFYSMMSLAPLLAFVVWMASLFFAERVVEGQLLGQVEAQLGAETANLIGDMLSSYTQNNSSGTIFSILSILVVIYFASTVFRIIKLTMNVIWDIAPEDVPRTGIVAFLWDRLLGFFMVILMGGAMVLLMLSNVIIRVLGDFIVSYVPGVEPYLGFAGFGSTFLIVTLLSAVAFKILPDLPLRWRDVFPGAVMAAVLFYAGNIFIGVYFSFSSLPAVYGAAGSLVIILLWVYYTALMFLFSALFSEAIARFVFGYGATGEKTVSEVMTPMVTDQDE